jgi:hypothetical protein
MSACPSDPLITLLARWQHLGPWQHLARLIAELRQQEQTAADMRRLAKDGMAVMDHYADLQAVCADGIRQAIDRHFRDLGDVSRLLSEYHEDLLPLWGREHPDGSRWPAFEHAEQARNVAQILAAVLARTAGPPSAAVQSASTPPVIDKISQAIALKQKHPDWSAKRIAHEVGCSEANLSQSKRWQVVAQAVRQTGAADAISAKLDRRAKDSGGRYRGKDMDEYASGAGSDQSGISICTKCASCGDPAGEDADGRPLTHQDKPRCKDCWKELIAGS